MGGRGGAPMRAEANVPASKASPTATVESQIRQAYDRLKTKPGGWVRLTELRSAVGVNERSTVDDALRSLANSGNAHFIPIANLKSLSVKDREAAIKVGGELKHLIAIDSGSR